MCPDESDNETDTRTTGRSAKIPPGRKPRWQFGLRKLMLWTTVVAVWCSIYTSLLLCGDKFLDLVLLWRVVTPCLILAILGHLLIGPAANEKVFAAMGVVLALAYYAVEFVFPRNLIHVVSTSNHDSPGRKPP